MKTNSNKKQSASQTPASGLPSRSDEQRSDSANTNTTNTTSTTAPAAPSIPSTPAKRILPFVNFAEREANRSLPSAEVLAHLRRWYPQAYDLAEMVGQWVWITFPEPPAESLRAGLSQLGFHWNNYRKCWQHPCGQFATQGSNADPREKYGSQMASAARTAADQVAA